MRQKWKEKYRPIKLLFDLYLHYFVFIEQMTMAEVSFLTVRGWSYEFKKILSPYL